MYAFLEGRVVEKPLYAISETKQSTPAVISTVFILSFGIKESQVLVQLFFGFSTNIFVNASC